MEQTPAFSYFDGDGIQNQSFENSDLQNISIRGENVKDAIMVSIVCNAYNQEKYISEAIESFLMQKTNFEFEVLIHDDASTDHTPDIIRSYERKYPDIIFPIYQTKNQYSQGIHITPKYQIPRARGKYIALCEGDDYWTDSNINWHPF